MISSFHFFSHTKITGKVRIKAQTTKTLVEKKLFRRPDETLKNESRWSKTDEEGKLVISVKGGGGGTALNVEIGKIRFEPETAFNTLDSFNKNKF